MNKVSNANCETNSKLSEENFHKVTSNLFSSDLLTRAGFRLLTLGCEKLSFKSPAYHSISVANKQRQVNICGLLGGSVR